MRLVIACCSVLAVSVLAACSTAPLPGPDVDRPMTVGNGLGSQHGNYAGQADGEMRLPAGERCVVFNWDRPLTNGRVLRLRSASCDSLEFPGRKIARELSRTIIPLSQSSLRDPDGKAVQ